MSDDISCCPFYLIYIQLAKVAFKKFKSHSNEPHQLNDIQQLNQIDFKNEVVKEIDSAFL